MTNHDTVYELLKEQGYYFDPSERQLRQIETNSPVAPAEVLDAIPELSRDTLRAYVRLERAIWATRDSEGEDSCDWSNCPI
jgi:hypothetical protein